MALTIATRAQDCLPGGSSQNTKHILYVGSSGSDVLDSGGFGQIYTSPTGAQPINLEKTGISVYSHSSDKYGSGRVKTAADRGWKWITDLGFHSRATNYFHVKMESPDDNPGFGGFCWERQANTVYVKGSFRATFSTLDTTDKPLLEVSLYEPNWNTENGGGSGPMQTWIWLVDDATFDSTTPTDEAWPRSGVNAAASVGYNSFSYRVDDDKIESFGNIWSEPSIRIEALPNNYGGPSPGNMDVHTLSMGSGDARSPIAKSTTGGTDIELYGYDTDDLWINQYENFMRSADPLYGYPNYAKFTSNEAEYTLPVQAPFIGGWGGLTASGWEFTGGYSGKVVSPREISATSYIGRQPDDADSNTVSVQVWARRGFNPFGPSEPSLSISVQNSGGTVAAAWTIYEDTPGMVYIPPMSNGIGQFFTSYTFHASGVQALNFRNVSMQNDMYVKIAAAGLNESQDEHWDVAGFTVHYGPPANMGVLIPKMVDGSISLRSLRLEMETNNSIFTVSGGRDIADSKGSVQSYITVNHENSPFRSYNANFLFNRDYGPSIGSEPSDITWNPLTETVVGPNEHPMASDGGSKLINSSYYEASKTTNYNAQARCRVAVDLEPFVESADILDNGTFRFRLLTTSLRTGDLGVHPTLLQPPEYQSWKCTFYYMTQEDPPTIGATSKIAEFTWYYGDSDADGYWTMNFDATASTILRNIVSGNQFMSPQAVNKFLVIQIQSLPDGWHTDYFDGLNEPAYLYPTSVSGESAGLNVVGGNSSDTLAEQITSVLCEPSDDTYVELTGKTAFRIKFSYPQLTSAMLNNDLDAEGVEYGPMIRPIYTFWSLNSGANAKYAEYRLAGTTGGLAPTYWWPNCRMDWGYYLDSNGSLKRLKNTNNLGVNDSTCPRWMGGTVDGYTSENIWKGNLDSNQTQGGLSPHEQGDMTLYLRNTSPHTSGGQPVGTKARISRARVVLKPFAMGHINFERSYFEFVPG